MLLIVYIIYLLKLPKTKKMASVNVDDVVAALESTRVSPSGVSFAGKSLKLDTEEDAKPVTEEIEKCKELQFLNMEGNTLGVDASKSIAKALEKHPEFKRALWKDMFTGRMKTEIPKALQYLGDGLVKSGARLTELDLSDNAFGPIGVEGLASLLRSSSCFALEELRLNNNGLGITGGKLLALALTDCYMCSKKDGKPMALKVFIAGRNRLENDGAKALAEVFKMIGTLEEIAMPQNGIYHVGISALSEAFSHNKNLQILNLNDNTIGPKGAEAIAKVLPNLQKLKDLNFGDCLLKTDGAISLAHALQADHTDLESLTLGFNEIKRRGGVEIVAAMANKTKLKTLVLDGNQFGEDGKTEIMDTLKKSGRFNALGSLSENESEDDDDDNEETEEDSESESEENEDDVTEVVCPPTSKVSVLDFLKTSSADNFIALGEDRGDQLLKEVKKSDNLKLEEFIPVLMKVSSLSNNNKESVRSSALSCSELLYRELFTWAQKTDNISIVNNTLLVNLGLIKNEDKIKHVWNMEGCFKALEVILSKNYIPLSTKDTMKLFMQREIDNKKEFLELKKGILSSLS